MWCICWKGQIECRCIGMTRTIHLKRRQFWVIWGLKWLGGLEVVIYQFLHIIIWHKCWLALCAQNLHCNVDSKYQVLITIMSLLPNHGGIRNAADRNNNIGSRGIPCYTNTTHPLTEVKENNLISSGSSCIFIFYVKLIFHRDMKEMT